MEEEDGEDGRGLLRQSTRRLIERSSPIGRVRALMDDPVGYDLDLWRR
jgi:hypothetical protein